MTWDPIWEQIFRERDWGRYPPEELIRFVARYFYRASDRGQIKILEIGCGPGANIWFLAREGFDAYGIDGSETAIAKAERALKEEGLKARLQVGDINSLCRLYPSSYFDALVDVACLQCNGTAGYRDYFGSGGDHPEAAGQDIFDDGSRWVIWRRIGERIGARDIC